MTISFFKLLEIILPSETSFFSYLCFLKLEECFGSSAFFIPILPWISYFFSLLPHDSAEEGLPRDESWMKGFSAI